MKRSRYKTVALSIGIPAAIVLMASIGLLVADYANARRHARSDEQRIETLQEMAGHAASHVAALEEERDRQTQASLDREARNETITTVLIIAAVLFLVCTKWLIALDDRPLPRPTRATMLCACRPRASSHADDRPLTTPFGQQPSEAEETAEIDLTAVDEVIAARGRRKELVIPILQAIQSHYHYLPNKALERICELTDITPAQIAGVSSFYKQFRKSPAGRHMVKVCHGTACHVAGSQTIGDEIRRYLSIGPESDTDPQRRFTIDEVACLGCCTLAPVVQIDGITLGHLTPDRVPKILNECLDAERSGAAKSEETRVDARIGTNGALGEIRVGLGSCCVAGGSGRLHEALKQAVAETGARAIVKRVGCVGMCHQTPLVEAVLPGRTPSLYAMVRPEQARKIVLRHFRAEGVARRMRHAASGVLEDLFRREPTQPIRRHAIDLRDPPVAAFIGKQKRIATEHCGRLDPMDLDEFLQHDGFRALERCVREVTQREVIDEIQASGLRGRGGGGYPAGLKWSQVREARGDQKYVVCNGDEGDPGAFMDRMLMESFPYRIIEGLAIAAYAVGAGEGYFYIRAEYPLAVERVREALRRCEQRGFLGNGKPGVGVKLRLQIMEGAGAFVCGEETALLASIEGERGMPRFRPPYPAERGLRGKPTLVSNVETCAMVPWIMRNGAAAFAELGTRASKGTKVFALAGKVNRGGLIEVPMGITIREIVEGIGGGIKDGRRFKAVQIGGPSGGCVPAKLADTAVDYEALAEVGAIMGSGGLVVMDDSDCMVDVARYFLAFTQDQSCGKCTYCRIGTRGMLDILNRLCAGEGRKDDLGELADLAEVVSRGSLCGLGRTAPNPVLTTLRYFKDEYEAHLEGRCPAGRCKALIAYRVTDDCVGCTLCAQHCPVEAIRFTPYEKHEIDADKCTRCGICRIKCPEDAIRVE